MSYTGLFMSAGPGRIAPLNESGDIAGGVEFTALSVSRGLLAAATGLPVGSSVVTVPPRPAPAIGTLTPLFGGCLFERVIVLPRVKALEFVLTATQFAIEVWNTFQNTDQVLTAINITGVGGLVVADPLGEPLLYAAQGSRIYQASLPSSGATNINQDVVFVFASGIGGTDCLVTGARIMVFSVAPEWGEGVQETIEYLTDVLKAYSDAEMRRAIRSIPRRALKFRALTLNPRDAAGMESLVWGWQQQPYGVPWWPDSQPLLGDIPAGSYAIPVATADRLFAPGGLICIWQSEFNFEALTIETVSAESVTVESPTQFSWTGGPGTRVVPVLLCRLPAKVTVSRFTSGMDQIDAAFIGEWDQLAPAPTNALTQYKGFDVLELAPNWESSPLKREYARSLITIDAKVGPITVIDKGGSAIVGQEFPWWLDTHPNITLFRAFILARFGQLNPFWLPTWDQDLVLARDIGAVDTGITIQSVFYSRFFFPSPARRFLAFIPIDGSGNVYREVTAAADNGDGTEGLTLDSPTGKAFTAASTIVSFLTLARLASDSVAIKWDSTEHAEAVLELQEVPRELPS